MSAINTYKSFQSYKDEYQLWRKNKNIEEAKRQKYLKENPNYITQKDIQKSKALLRAVDLMDEYTYKKNANFEIISNSVLSLGLEYSAIGGTALGFLLTKTKRFKNIVKKIARNSDKTSRLINTGFTTISGVFATILTFPLYNWASKSEAKAYRKNRHEVMQNELKDPRIFATLTEVQEKTLNKNIENFTKNKNSVLNPFKTFKEKIEDIKNFSEETFSYKNDKKKFEKELFSDKNYYHKELTSKEIEQAKEDQQILIKLVDKINVASQDYQEKAKIVTTTLITGGFALGSLFALAYERLMKRLKLRSSALPANFGLYLMLGMSLLGVTIEKKAQQIGRFKVKQELINNPEQLIYVSDEITKEINDIQIENNKISTLQFIKEFFKDNREYEKWKKERFSKEKNLSKAFNNINLDDEQIKNAKLLQRNMFKTFSRMDDNSQKHAESIAVLGQAIQYPLTLILNTFVGLYGFKHLDKLAKAKTQKEILVNSLKYIGTILLFTLPSIFINNRIIKEEKEAIQISDMLTIQNMDDYRKFADYSRYKITL